MPGCFSGVFSLMFVAREQEFVGMLVLSWNGARPRDMLVVVALQFQRGCSMTAVVVGYEKEVLSRSGRL